MKKIQEENAPLKAKKIVNVWLVINIVVVVLFLLLNILLTPTCSRIAAQDCGATTSIKILHHSCKTFRENDCGLNDKFGEKYFGYPRQTQDLLDAEIKTDDGPESIRGIDKALCAESGKEGVSCGYVFRYAVLGQHRDEKSGMLIVDDYMITAWPEQVGISGTRVFISKGSSGEIYERVLDRAETREEMLITEWPSEEELSENWRLVPKN